MAPKKRILIVNPPIRLSDKPRHIPHGLAILANIIRKKINCELFFIDWNAYRYTEQQFISLIKQIPCEIALIGGLIPTYKNLIKISEIIKSIHPKCSIIAGGSAAMSVPDVLLQNSKVDIICTGEGELVIIDLIKHLMEGAYKELFSIEGIAYKDSENNFIINKPKALIDDLDLYSDMPAYDLLPMEIYLKNPIIGLGRDIDFISGRGCPFNCVFCYQPWGRKNRRHSAEFIKEAILFLQKKFKINFISFQDDLFILDKKRLTEFCQLRNTYFPDIKWSCHGRANICNDEILQLVRNSGCTLVSYGFESGSPKILKKMKKGITIEQMENVVMLNRKYGFPVPTSFIFGFPGENEQTCNETISFCKKNNLTLDSLMFATPYPGTELFEYVLKTGRLQKDDIHYFLLKLSDARDFVINLTDSFTDQELQKKYTEMIKTAKLHYKPISDEEVNEKINDLYGDLAIHFFNLSEKDQIHRKKHGGIAIF